MKGKVTTREGARLFQELLHQSTDLGAIPAIIYGSLGAGKSTLLRTIAEGIQCEDPVTEEFQMMTIIWRCRDIDIWNSFDSSITKVFIHKDDINYVRFRTDRLQKLTKKDLPKIITYTTMNDLYSKVVKGNINCIFEPQDYELSEYMKKLLLDRGADKKKVKESKVDRSVWWIEFSIWLLQNKGLDFISMILDEFDEMMPSGVGGVQWHLAHLYRDYLRVSRKMNISTILCAHQEKDINPVILSKILVRIYLKGAVAGANSLIVQTAPITLRRGLGFIERDAWGMFEFDKLEMKDKVVTSFVPKPDTSDEDEDMPFPPHDEGYYTVDKDGVINFNVDKIIKDNILDLKNIKEYTNMTDNPFENINLDETDEDEDTEEDE